MLERVAYVEGKGRKPKGIVVRNRTPGGFNFLYYPQRQHVVNFVRAAKALKDYGPATEFPGAVGSISIKAVQSGETKRFILSHVQSHFKTGPNAANGELSRALSTFYGGWAYRAFAELFKMAKTKQYTLIAYRNQLSKHYYEQLERAAKETGFTIAPYSADKPMVLILKAEDTKA